MGLAIATEAIATASARLSQYTPPVKSLATFEIGAIRFLAHPTEPYMFATIPETNSLAIFNTNTLQLEANFFVGSRPYGMALSNDGNTLYVANSMSHFLTVVDWKAKTVTRELAMPEPLLDVEVGSNGELYVLSDRSLSRLEYREGMLFLNSSEFFQRSNSPVEVQLVFTDQSSMTIAIYVRHNDFAWHNGSGIVGGTSITATSLHDTS
jgi:DNA-binding beta-propeller fold protein YncE